MVAKHLKNTMRKLKYIRILYSPFKKIINTILLYEFRFSGERKKLLKYRNMYMNKRCFIIGNGPSLNLKDLEMLKGEVTFASNKIYKMFHKTQWRPTFWVCSDCAVLDKSREAFKSLNEITCLVSYKGKKIIPNTENTLFFFEETKFLFDFMNPVVSFNANASNCIGFGGTVTYCSIQLAIYMGFKQIYLLGVDHQYSRSIDNKGILHINKSIKDYPSEMIESDIEKQSQPVKYLDVSNKAYKEAKKQANKLEVEIFNATRGGVLEVFKRVNLDDIL
jgi:hypothetical protein